MRPEFQQRYTKKHGYMVGRHSQPPNSKKKRRNFAASLKYLDSGAPVSFDDLDDLDEAMEDEITAAEADCLAQIREHGYIEAGSGTTLESMYDHMGWSDSLTTPTALHDRYFRAYWPEDVEKDKVKPAPWPPYRPMWRMPLVSVKPPPPPMFEDVPKTAEPPPPPPEPAYKAMTKEEMADTIAAMEMMLQDIERRLEEKIAETNV